MKKLLLFLKRKQKFIIYTLMNLLVKIIGLGSNIIIVRKLTVSDFGTFSIALMVVSFVINFGFSWSSSSILYFGSKEKQRYGNINKTFWARNVIIFSTLLIFTLGFIVFQNQINDYIGVNISYLLLIWIYISVLENYLHSYFLAMQKQLLSIFLSVTAKIIYLILILLFNFDVTTLVLLNIISHATVIIYILAINKKDFGKFEFDYSWFKQILNFSLWQLFGFAGIYLINFGDVAIVKYYLTQEDVAMYNAGYQLFLGIATFANLIASYYASSVTANFDSNNKSQIKYFFYKERIYIFLLSAILHVILFVTAKPIVLLLYGEQYLNSVIIVKILLIGSLFKYLERFYMLYYNANGKYKMQQMINIFGAVFNIILSIILIKIMGLTGPAIATTISFLITFAFSVIYCEKRILLFLKK